jgi:hypothetical protein
MEDYNPFKNELAELLVHYFPELRGKGRHLVSVEIQVGRSTADVSELSIVKLDTAESGPAFGRLQAHPANDRSIS